MILIFDAHQEGIDDSWLFVVIRHNAADEGGLGGHQHVDQVVQLVAEVGAHRLEVRHLGGGLRLHHHPLLAPPVAGGRQVLLLLGLARVVGVDLAHEGAGLCLLEQVDHGVVDGVPVLVEPASDVVGHSAGIVNNGKVSVLVCGRESSVTD